MKVPHQHEKSKFCHFKLQQKPFGMKHVFRSLKQIKHFRRKKTIQMLTCPAVVSFACAWRLFYFSAVTCMGFIFPLKKLSNKKRK